MKHKKCKSDSINGTSLKGYITTTYADLCRTFGAPSIFVGDKTNAEWFIEFEDGSVATVYDWKLDHIPLEPYRWHIGGLRCLCRCIGAQCRVRIESVQFYTRKGECTMLLTNEEVVEILDDRLDYSDFGDWSGDEDDLIEFAYHIVKAEDEKG
jgi:hypothetical protein